MASLTLFDKPTVSSLCTLVSTITTKRSLYHYFQTNVHGFCAFNVFAGPCAELTTFLTADSPTVSDITTLTQLSTQFTVQLTTLIKTAFRAFALSKLLPPDTTNDLGNVNTTMTDAKLSTESKLPKSIHPSIAELFHVLLFLYHAETIALTPRLSALQDKIATLSPGSTHPPSLTTFLLPPHLDPRVAHTSATLSQFNDPTYALATRNSFVLTTLIHVFNHIWTLPSTVFLASPEDRTMEAQLPPWHTDIPLAVDTRKTDGVLNGNNMQSSSAFIHEFVTSFLHALTPATYDMASSEHVVDLNPALSSTAKRFLIAQYIHDLTEATNTSLLAHVTSEQFFTALVASPYFTSAENTDIIAPALVGIMNNIFSAPMLSKFSLGIIAHVIGDFINGDIAQTVDKSKSKPLITPWRKVYTGKYTRFNRFNLFYESIEGYSKLVFEVTSAFARINHTFNHFLQVDVVPVIIEQQLHKAAESSADGPVKLECGTQHYKHLYCTCKCGYVAHDFIFSQLLHYIVQSVILNVPATEMPYAETHCPLFQHCLSFMSNTINDLKDVLLQVVGCFDLEISRVYDVLTMIYLNILFTVTPQQHSSLTISSHLPPQLIAPPISTESSKAITTIDSHSQFLVNRDFYNFAQHPINKLLSSWIEHKDTTSINSGVFSFINSPLSLLYFGLLQLFNIDTITSGIGYQMTIFSRNSGIDSLFFQELLDSPSIDDYSDCDEEDFDDNSTKSVTNVDITTYQPSFQDNLDHSTEINPRETLLDFNNTIQLANREERAWIPIIILCAGLLQYNIIKFDHIVNYFYADQEQVTPPSQQTFPSLNLDTSTALDADISDDEAPAPSPDDPLEFMDDDEFELYEEQRKKKTKKNHRTQKNDKSEDRAPATPINPNDLKMPQISPVDVSNSILLTMVTQHALSIKLKVDALIKQFDIIKLTTEDDEISRPRHAENDEEEELEFSDSDDEVSTLAIQRANRAGPNGSKGKQFSQYNVMSAVKRFDISFERLEDVECNDNDDPNLSTTVVLYSDIDFSTKPGHRQTLNLTDDQIFSNTKDITNNILTFQSFLKTHFHGTKQFDFYHSGANQYTKQPLLLLFTALQSIDAYDGAIRTISEYQYIHITKLSYLDTTPLYIKHGSSSYIQPFTRPIFLQSDDRTALNLLNNLPQQPTNGENGSQQIRAHQTQTHLNMLQMGNQCNINYNIDFNQYFEQLFHFNALSFFPHQNQSSDSTYNPFQPTFPFLSLYKDNKETLQQFFKITPINNNDDSTKTTKSSEFFDDELRDLVGGSSGSSTTPTTLYQTSLDLPVYPFVSLEHLYNSNSMSLFEQIHIQLLQCTNELHTLYTFESLERTLYSTSAAQQANQFSKTPIRNNTPILNNDIRRKSIEAKILQHHPLQYLLPKVIENSSNSTITNNSYLNNLLLRVHLFYIVVEPLMLHMQRFYINNSILSSINPNKITMPILSFKTLKYVLQYLLALLSPIHSYLALSPHLFEQTCLFINLALHHIKHLTYLHTQKPAASSSANKVILQQLSINQPIQSDPITLLKTEAATVSSDASPEIITFTEIFTIIIHVLFPSLALLPGSFAFNQSIWSVLTHLSHPDRFAIYHHVETQAKLPYAPLFATSITQQYFNQLYTSRTKWCRKRLSNDKVNEISILTPKFMLPAPVTALPHLFEHLKQYTALQQPVIELCANQSTLIFDIFIYNIHREFCTLFRSVHTKTHMSSDLGIDSTALDRCAQFYLSLYKNYPAQCDLQPYLEIIIRYSYSMQLAASSLITTMLSNICNIQNEDDITVEKVKSTTSSFFLQYLSQSTTFEFSKLSINSPPLVSLLSQTVHPSTPPILPAISSTIQSLTQLAHKSVNRPQTVSYKNISLLKTFLTSAFHFLPQIPAKQSSNVAKLVSHLKQMYLGGNITYALIQPPTNNNKTVTVTSVNHTSRHFNSTPPQCGYGSRYQLPLLLHANQQTAYASFYSATSTLPTTALNTINNIANQHQTASQTPIKHPAVKSIVASELFHSSIPLPSQAIPLLSQLSGTNTLYSLFIQQLVTYYFFTNNTQIESQLVNNKLIEKYYQNLTALRACLSYYIDFDYLLQQTILHNQTVPPHNERFILYTLYDFYLHHQLPLHIGLYAYRNLIYTYPQLLSYNVDPKSPFNRLTVQQQSFLSQITEAQKIFSPPMTSHHQHSAISNNAHLVQEIPQSFVNLVNLYYHDYDGYKNDSFTFKINDGLLPSEWINLFAAFWYYHTPHINHVAINEKSKPSIEPAQQYKHVISYVSDLYNTVSNTLLSKRETVINQLQAMVVAPQINAGLPASGALTFDNLSNRSQLELEYDLLTQQMAECLLQQRHQTSEYIKYSILLDSTSIIPFPQEFILSEDGSTPSTTIYLETVADFHTKLSHHQQITFLSLPHNMTFISMFHSSFVRLILQRALLSSTDAFYAANFIHSLRKSKHVVGFMFTLLVDLLLDEIQHNVITASTKDEVKRIGIFINELFYFIPQLFSKPAHPLSVGFNPVDYPLEKQPCEPLNMSNEFDFILNNEHYESEIARYSVSTLWMVLPTIPKIDIPTCKPPPSTMKSEFKSNSLPISEEIYKLYDESHYKQHVFTKEQKEQLQMVDPATRDEEFYLKCADNDDKTNSITKWARDLTMAQYNPLDLDVPETSTDSTIKKQSTDAIFELTCDQFYQQCFRWYMSLALSISNVIQDCINVRLQVGDKQCQDAHHKNLQFFYGQILPSNLRKGEEQKSSSGATSIAQKHAQLYGTSSFADEYKFNTKSDASLLITRESRDILESHTSSWLLILRQISSVFPLFSTFGAVDIVSLISTLQSTYNPRNNKDEVAYTDNSIGHSEYESNPDPYSIFNIANNVSNMLNALSRQSALIPVPKIFDSIVKKVIENQNGPANNVIDFATVIYNSPSPNDSSTINIPTAKTTTTTVPMTDNISQ